VSEQIRFHLDENVDPDVAKGLRRRGIDVTTTVEMDLLGQPDEVQFDFVCRQERVIVTHDTDFFRLAIQSSEHCGIAFCQKGTRSIGEIIRSLILLYEVFTPEEMKGTVEYL
jgi:predicted nuclease of predicted toxin-antitoxin system